MFFFVAAFKLKYASGMSPDVNGIAAYTGPAILWWRAIASLASMDDCLSRVDCACHIRGHKSHRAGASSGLGPTHGSRSFVRGWRLVSLCASHAGRVRCFKEIAARSPVPPAACPAALPVLFVVLRRVGHLRSGATPASHEDLCSRHLSHCDAGRSNSILVTGRSRLVELDLHHAAVRCRGLSVRRWNRTCNPLLHRCARQGSAGGTAVGATLERALRCSTGPTQSSFSFQYAQHDYRA